MEQYTSKFCKTRMFFVVVLFSILSFNSLPLVSNGERKSAGSSPLIATKFVHENSSIKMDNPRAWPETMAWMGITSPFSIFPKKYKD